MDEGHRVQGWEDLESVLDSFEERRAAELEAGRAAAQDEVEFRETCVDLLERVVVPTLNAAGRSLGKRGHECSIARRIANYDIPSADLTVRPYIPEEKWVRRSRLSMRCACAEGFVVYGEVSPPHKDPIILNTVHPLDDVTDEWIKQQILKFVRAVLNEY
ncbi:MAG: hypothetical protein OEU54_12440 [Gemmatimonadota bacterium]|nr:hypothetical protein [Gemmatimonadota bacterium]